MNLILLLLAALSLHRIWNYEDVMAPVRAWFPWKPLSCAVCNPFWIAVLIAGAGFALGLIVWPVAVLFPFAAYLPIRATVWVYDRIEGVPLSATTAAPKGVKTCSTCGQKQADLAAQREKALTYKERVVILTAHLSLNPRIAMFANVLAREKDRQVQIWLSAATPPDALEAASRAQSQIGSNVVVRAIVPFAPDEKVDQIADEKTVAQLSGEIGMQLMTLGNAKVLTVDALYDPHLLPLAQAIQQFSQTKAFAWVHSASGVSGWKRPTDPAVSAARATIPNGHTAIVGATFVQDAVDYYQTDRSAVSALSDANDVSAALRDAKPLA